MNYADVYKYYYCCAFVKKMGQTRQPKVGKTQTQNCSKLAREMQSRQKRVIPGILIYCCQIT